MNLSDSIHAVHQVERHHIIDAFESHHELQKRATKIDECACRGQLYFEGAPPTVRLWIYRCGDRLCPLCARHRSKRVAEQLRQVMLVGRITRHFVLTVRTSPGQSLVESLRHLRDSFRKLRRLPIWKEKVLGGAYVIEITKNAKNGCWHPHIHILANGIYFPLRLLSQLWAQITDDSMNVWICAAHGKHANHLAKYAAKPPRLETWPAAAITEYALATHGTRMVQTFGNLHALKLEDKDEHPEPAATRHVMNLSTLHDQAAAGHPAAIALTKAVAVRWPRLWQYLRSAIDLPPPASIKDHLTDIERAQEAVDHTAKFAIPLATSISNEKKRI